MEDKINRLETYMESLAANEFFNGAVLFGHKGEILLKKGYGYASFQYDISNSSTTKFRVGSLTKAFTAIGIMLLHEKGKLDIDHQIDKILADYPNGSVITIRHLLTNTSGIPNFTSSPEYWVKTMRLPSNLDAVIDSFKNLPLEFTPGTDMNYSNSGYLVLTKIIEKASGQSYADFLQNEIFKKLGLKCTGIDDGRRIVKSMAEGYTVWGDIIHTEHIDMSFPLGAYGMYSTLEDLYIWCQALLKSTLVDQSLQEQMFTNINRYGYGFGWFIDEGEYKTCSHFGDVNGFVNHLVMYPNEDLVVIVLSNLNITPVTQISSDLAKIIFGEEVNSVSLIVPLEGDSLPLGSFEGTYKSDKVEITVRHDDNELFAVVPKMYGVPYKFRLQPIQVEAAKMICKSDFINDTYTFFLDNNRAPYRLEFTDCYGQVCLLERQKL
ncbi:serine hydrolase domain-containing protein [Neobacillus sp. 114]|uniref:serine hydrolase domain-containing protein n=1 Tax=Neobacillus sp. 114 TaxID=3048535 RepID=UPI0024C3A855|nr:serine hydrolase domain-containing protein [Neobacillus sp. 114]